MKVYFLSENNKKGNNAGSKARNDFEKIFTERDFIKINNSSLLAKNYDRGIGYYISNLFISLNIFIKLIKMKRNVIFIQYPVLKGKILNIALKITSKKNDIYCIIHDINALRLEKDKQADMLYKEIKLLNNFQGIVLHNECMIKKLKDSGLKSESINLEIFDYILNNNVEVDRVLSNEIVYAGNLKKGIFLDELLKKKNIGIKLNLYGPNFNEKIDNTYVKFKGNFLPEVVVDKLEGSFGLIWDGTTLEECNGILGEYTRYNNPHKLSLYIASRIPVIVWSKSAISKFVKKYNIGISVNSIYEIKSKIQEMTEEEYVEMIKNIDKLRRDITIGNYSNSAIDKILSRYK